MSISRGVGATVLGIVGIVILVVAGGLIFSQLSGSTPIKESISRSIELRNADSSVDRARLVSAMDDLVVEIDNSGVTDQWERMLQCLATTCPDEAFFDMVLVTTASFETELENSALLINIIATAKYWGNVDHMLDFSHALSTADNQVDSLENRSAQKLWRDVVDCNNECPERNDLYFELIQEIVQ